MRRTGVAAIAAAVGLLVAAGLAPAQLKRKADERRAVPGELLVQFRSGVSASSRSVARDRADARLLRPLRVAGLQLLRTGAGRSVAETVRSLEADPRVEFAEPNLIYRALATTPNDSRFGELWGLHNLGQTVNGTAGTSDADIDGPEGWDLATGNGDVLVAIADEGVAYDHPDLAPNMWINPGEVAGNGIDDDGNGEIDDVRGFDFADSDSDPRDHGGHGTHVAGTVAGAGNNAAGVPGVSWTAQLVAVRVLDSDGSGTLAAITEGFDYAGDIGAKVVNASFGGSGTPPAALTQAVQDHPNTLYVVAAGNETNNNDVNPVTPCNITAANLICVAATDQSDGLASFSNFGTTSVDLGAPGTNILSTKPHYATILSDGFETAADFTTRWNPGSWGRTATAQASGSFSAADSPAGNYGNSQQNVLITQATVDLRARQGCYLNYELRLATVGADTLFVVASTDVVLTQADVREAFAGSTGGLFVPIETYLESDGQQVFIAFALQSDSSVTADGAYLDDVRVECVSSDYTDADFQFLDGTSMASPHVAGAAALVFGYRPAATVAFVRDALLTTGDQKAALAGTTVTGRRLNVFNALQHGGPRPAQPLVTTGAATGVAQDAATLSGTVNPRGTATSYRFEIGTTTAYGSTAPATPVDSGSGNAAQNVSQGLAGLQPSTTYHFRLVALRGSERTSGPDQKFTTAVAPPPPGGGGGTGTTPPTGGSTGAGNNAEGVAGVTTTSNPLASVRVSGCKRRGRGRKTTVSCKLAPASQVARFSARLTRRGKTVARASGKPGKGGAMTLTIKKTLGRGTYVLTLTLTDAAGKKRTLRRTLRF